MALTDFFRINLPYGIRGNNTKGWFAFNREYKPIGFNKTEWDDRVKYEDYPIFTEYKSLTEKKMKELNDNDSGELLKEGEDFLIFLYNDGTNPASNKNNKSWDRYFEKLKILSKLKRKTDY